jgi:hypothetical protein
MDLTFRATIRRIKHLWSSGRRHLESRPMAPSFSELPVETSSAANLDLARGWLMNCQNHHSDCTWISQSKMAPWTPRRLLYIGNAGDHTCRLCITDEMPVTPMKYITLSHRWSSFNKLILTRSSLETFKKGISISDLPKTFRDTILVSRYLSIDYIWIDCLCILQDSTKDWQKEAGEMSQVYSHATCNIVAADASENYDKGLFRSRDPRFISSFQVQRRLLGRAKRYDGFAYSNFYDNLFDASLYKRGWVLQERLLAPRTLHFGRYQMVWVCQKRMASETLPEGGYQPSFHLSLGVLKELPMISGSSDTGDSCRMPDRIYKMWRGILEHYSSRRLTFPTDRLVALSGVAQVFRDRTGDQYLFGLWRSHLFDSLCWIPWPESHLLPLGRQHFIEYKDCQVPSWSWAAINSPVNFLFRFRKPLEKLKPLGNLISIQGGSEDDENKCRLVIHAPVFRTVWRVGKSASNQQTLPPFQGNLYLLNNDDTMVRTQWSKSSVYLDISWPELYRDGTMLYFLILFVSKDFGDETRYTGLQLQEITGQAGTYRRVGIFQIEQDRVGDISEQRTCTLI